MKTAARENPNSGVAGPCNRAYGAVGQNRSRSITWAEKQEKFQPKETCFFLHSPFIELIRTWELLRFHSKLEKSSDEVEDVKNDRPSTRIQAIHLLASRLNL